MKSGWQRKKVLPEEKSRESLSEPNGRQRPEASPPCDEKMLQTMAVLQLITQIQRRRQERHVTFIGGRGRRQEKAELHIPETGSEVTCRDRHCFYVAGDRTVNVAARRDGMRAARPCGPVLWSRPLCLEGVCKRTALWHLPGMLPPMHRDNRRLPS